MSQSATQILATPGDGISLSAFTVNSKVRQTVTLGDDDNSAAGEVNTWALPAHDEADRGSPGKIGGRANAAASASKTATRSRMPKAWHGKDPEATAPRGPRASSLTCLPIKRA